MEDNKFSIDDTVKFTTSSGKVIEGKVIGIKPYGYVIEHDGKETIYSKSIVEVEPRSKTFSRGGRKTRNKKRKNKQKTRRRHYRYLGCVP